MNRTATSTMTRERTWALTAISVILFILLCWIFDDGLLAPPLWNGENWISSPLLTYLLIAIIILCGWSQARGIPERGTGVSPRAHPLDRGSDQRSDWVAPPDGQHLLRAHLAPDALLPRS